MPGQSRLVRERRFNGWAQKPKEQGAGDGEADSTFEKVSGESVDEVAQELSRDDCDSEPPSPTSSPKPARARDCESDSQKKERDSDQFAQRREVLVGARIEPPDVVQGSAWPDESYSRERSHGGAEQEEHAEGH